jgi:8-oxo-dGTP diphosphatase
MNDARWVRVVAGVIVRNGRTLIGQRRKNDHFPLKWEFPGGKVEVGEKPLAALRRELQEELGIKIGAARRIFRHRHRYPELRVDLYFYRVARFRGRPVNRRFRRLQWVGRADLARYDFLDGDQPLILKLARGRLLI